MPRNLAAQRRAIRVGGVDPVAGQAAPASATQPARPEEPATLLNIEARVYLRPRVEGRVRRALYNPSVLVRGDALLVAIREFDGSRTPHSRIVVTSLDTAWRVGDARPVSCPPVGRLGPEDVRLFDLPDGRPAGIATVGESLDWNLALLVFDSEITQVVETWRFAGRHKNWSPVLDGSGRLMFAPHGPALSIDVAGRRLATDVSRLRFAATDMRGGTQLVPRGDGFISITHELRGKCYGHRFVRYSKQLEVERVGPPFFFEAPEGIEYAAGLAYWQGRWVIAYGMADREARIAVVLDTTVDRMLGTKGER